MCAAVSAGLEVFYGIRLQRLGWPQRSRIEAGLTPTESQVAAWLAEGKSVRQMAEATGHTTGSIFRRLMRIYRKQSISRQVDLVLLVLSIVEFG